MTIPHIPKELLEYLEALYPEKVPEINWTDREVWAYTGKVKVVRKLRQLYTDQLERSMIKRG